MRTPRLVNWTIIVLSIYLSVIGGTFLTYAVLEFRIFHRIILYLVLGGWLLARLIRREPLPSTPLDGPLLALFLVYVGAMIFALDPRISLEFLWDQGIHILLFYVVVDLMRRYGPEAVVSPLLLAAGTLILTGILQVIGWYFGLFFFDPGWFEIGGWADPIPPRIYRLEIGPLAAPEMSGYLAALIPVALGWRMASRQPRVRVPLAVWLVGAIFLLVFTFSRGGLLSLAVGLGSLSLLRLADTSTGQTIIAQLRANWRARLIGVVVGMLLLAGVGGLLYWLGANRDALAGGSTLASDLERLDLWRSAWLAGWRDPLTGVGPFGFGRALRLTRNPEFGLGLDRIFRPHNLLLGVWAEAGLPGIAALGWLAIRVAAAAFRRWNNAEGAERIRVAACVAATLGLTAHNMVDLLLYTPNLLPYLLAGAYLVLPLEQAAMPSRIRRLAPAVILAVMLLVTGGWVISDRAYAFATRANRLEARGNVQGAVDAIEVALESDPGIGLYHMQYARYLGKLVLQDRAYLPDALHAYEIALAYDSTYDVPFANYALLLKLDGQMESALEAMQRAQAIYPVEPRYTLWISELAEQSGDLELARASYAAAVQQQPYWAISAFWDQTELRRAVRDNFLNSQGLQSIPRNDLRQMSAGCWPSLAGRDLTDYDLPQQESCEAEVALFVDDHPAEAIAHLDTAISARPGASGLYMLRAQVYLAVGDRSAAERDARTALFLGDPRGYLILGHLARLSGDLQLAESYYRRVVPNWGPRVGWALPLYSRRDTFTLAVEWTAPANAPDALAGWVALADLYEEMGDHARAQMMIEMIDGFDRFYLMGDDAHLDFVRVE